MKRKEAARLHKRPQVKGGNAQEGHPFSARRRTRLIWTGAWMFARGAQAILRAVAKISLQPRLSWLRGAPQKKGGRSFAQAAPSQGRKRPRRATATTLLHSSMNNAALHKKQDLPRQKPATECRTCRLSPRSCPRAPLALAFRLMYVSSPGASYDAPWRSGEFPE